MTISLIAAMAENRVIGHAASLPWHLPKDMRRFKELTTGHTVIMGRKTFDTLPNPLPNRNNVVITRNVGYTPSGVETAHDFDDALAAHSTETELFIVGGQQIYELALPRAERIYLTLVHATPEGDTFFPHFQIEDWCLGEDVRFQPDEKHAYPYSFRLYTRRSRY